MRKEEVRSTLKSWINSLNVRLQNVLLLPPDFTRGNSGAGIIVEELYELLGSSVEIDIMPALGTHVPMSDEELTIMFGSKIPSEDW